MEKVRQPSVLQGRTVRAFPRDKYRLSLSVSSAGPGWVCWEPGEDWVSAPTGLWLPLCLAQGTHSFSAFYKRSCSHLRPGLHQGLLQEKSVPTSISLVTTAMPGTRKLSRKLLSMEAILLVFNQVL